MGVHSGFCDDPEKHGCGRRKAVINEKCTYYQGCSEDAMICGYCYEHCLCRYQGRGEVKHDKAVKAR